MNKKKANMLRTLKATAYHEAGHAVVAFIFNVPMGITTIVPNKERGTLGHCVWKTPKRLQPDVTIDARTAYRIGHEVIGRLAGREAEKLFTGRNNHIGASSDDRAVMNLAGYLHEDPEEMSLYLRLQALCTRNLISSEDWRPCVEAVATALLTKPTLRAADVKRIIRESLDSGRVKS